MRRPPRSPDDGATPPPIALRKIRPVRYLAIDLGDKRTGLAAGDAATRLAAPLRVIDVPLADRAGGALLDALAAAIDEFLGPNEPGELVLGLPLHMDGSEGPRAKLVRAFAARLEQRCNRPVHLHDERLTSDRANQLMGKSGLTHAQKKARRDAIAAAAILQSFLDALLR